MFLFVKPSGGKLWRLKYRIAGKEKLLSLGTYSEVTLKKARKRREDARELVADGIDPSEVRRATKEAEAGAESFQAVALEWFGKYTPTWAPTNAAKIIGRLCNDVFS